MGEERGRGGHPHNVGIALEAGHEGGFEDGSLIVVPLLALAVTGVFAGKDLRPLAVVAVVAQAIGEEPLFVAVIVLIDKVGLQLPHGLPSVSKLIGGIGIVVGHGAAGAYYLDVGIFLADGFDEGLEAFVVELTPLFVAHADVLHVERSGMAHVGTHLPPLGIGGAVGKLDEIEAVVDIRLQLIHRHVGTLLVPVLELAGESDAEDGQRLGTDVLSKLEELEEAQSVRLKVVREIAMVEGVLPTVLVEWTVLDGANGVLPLIACL